MRYIFKVLILGNPETIHFYASSAFGEPGEDNKTYFEWYKEVRVLEDNCDLEIDVITSESADLDEIIPIVDGIIYFLNPLEQDEFEILKMVLPDIFSVKRDIPIIIVFYDQNGILPLSVNELLENVWVNYPNLEAFVNLSPNEFHQALQSLCLAMINGDTPLNIENAWMRFPIFIQMANIYFNNKNYYYAAQTIRKAALIAEIYNKEEYYIISEQAAYLFSKINLYLEASKILENIDRRKSVNFKTLYADAMIREANLFFNKQEYETAAAQYERAGQWASIEILEKKIIDEAFKLAINSWISACKVENAFRILENLPLEEVLSILKDISEKIGAAAEFLIDNNKFESAREQLYRAVNRYQREALPEELKKITSKLTEILIRIIKIEVEEKNNEDAKKTYDEIENMWESYKVEKTDLDSILSRLINNFLEENNFSKASVLINKLNSRILKQDLTKLSSEIEDRYKASIKKEMEEYIGKGIEILNKFVDAELDIIAKMNSEKIQEANEFIKENDYIGAANHLKHQAKYLENIGKDDIKAQILTKSLDILLEGKKHEKFFDIFDELSEIMKKRYLNRIFPIYLESLKEIKESESYERNAKILDNSVRIFRNQMLYDESKDISKVFIKAIKQEALRILESEEDLSGIKKAKDLVKKVSKISSSYLEQEEKVKITFNKIYKNIAEIYIDLDDLPSAHAYNDKIEKKEYKTEIHKKIAKLEAEKSALASRRAEESFRGEILKEKLSIIKNKGSEARLDRDNELKERRALKRAYFNDALSLIKSQEYEKAVEIYKKNIKKLNKIKKYKLASVCLAIASLLFIIKHRFEDAEKLLDEIKKELTVLGKLFSETFPVALIEYIIGLKKIQDESKLKEALSYFEYLPLFEEELETLYNYLGKEYIREKIPEKTIKPIAEIEKIKSIETPEEEVKETLSRKEIGELSKLRIEMDQQIGKIQSKMGDIRREKDEFLNKRKAMRKRYYNNILDLVKSKKFKEAGSKYLELAQTTSKRKDLRTSSLLILLHGLSLLKAGESFKLIKNNINSFLNSLGVNKKLVKDTFYVMVILFLIDVKSYSLDKFLSKIKEMLEILPLFDEEKVLIETEE